MTMEEVKNLHNSDVISKEKLANEIRELSERSATVDRELSDAAEARNVTKYATLKAEKEMLADAIRTKRTRLVNSKLSYDTREAALSAWTRHASKFNVEFAKKKRDYELAKHRLAGQFMELFEMQRAALVDRAVVNSLVNDDDRAVQMNVIDGSMANLELIATPSCFDNTHYQGKQYSPDAAFFEAAGEIDRETAEQINYVVLYHGVIR